jgi:apyrase
MRRARIRGAMAFAPTRAASSPRSLTTLVVFIVVIALTVTFTLWSDAVGFASTRTSKRFSIVLDAGSTGSRVHVFTFQTDYFGRERLHSEYFHAIEPGLKSYGSSADAASASLDELISRAKSVVPELARSATPFSVRATAGLRLMPEGQGAADAIMDSVRAKIARAGFHPQSETFVSIMDGVDEGAHGWVATNYLLERLGKSPESTVAVIDLGGGSTQIAYAVGSAIMDKAPSGYVRKIQTPFSAYSAYIHSFKGYGLIAVRAKLYRFGKRDEDGTHPCLPGSVQDTCTKDCYGLEPGETYEAKGSATLGTDFKRCLAAVIETFEEDNRTKCGRGPCSFAGAWTTPRKTPLYVMSYIVERGVQAGVAPHPKTPSTIVSTTAGAFKTAASHACVTPQAKLASEFPLAVAAKVDVDYLCLELTYIYALLTTGYGVSDTETIHMLDKIRYKNQDVEASWALGDGIATLGAATRSYH